MVSDIRLILKPYFTQPNQTDYNCYPFMITNKENNKENCEY